MKCFLSCKACEFGEQRRADSPRVSCKHPSAGNWSGTTEFCIYFSPEAITPDVDVMVTKVREKMFQYDSTHLVGSPSCFTCDHYGKSLNDSHKHFTCSKVEETLSWATTNICEKYDPVSPILR